MTLERYQNPIGYNELMNNIFADEKICNKQYFAIPPANIIESKVDFRIDIAAPGFEKSDFSIDLEKNLLTISIDKHVDESDDESYNYKEFNFNKFNRTFRLSQKLNTDKINAIYKNGVLQIVLPKKEDAIEKPKKDIKIS